MTGEHTPVRKVRVGDLWEQAQAVAVAHGVTMSDLVRAALAAFIERPDLPALLAAARSRAPRAPR